MGAVVFKQPNGLYGRYSYTSDSFESYNMTEEEVLKSMGGMEAMKYDLEVKRAIDIIKGE